MIQLTVPSVFNDITQFFKEMTRMNFLVDQELEDDGIKLKVYTNKGEIPEEMKPKIRGPGKCKVLILTMAIIALCISTSMLLLQNVKIGKLF